VPDQPRIDFENLPAPSEGILLTHFIIVRDVARSRAFYADVLGGEVSTFLNLRVADIEACYRDWKSKGAEFVTEPIDRGAEVRCYMRDPDGFLIEVGQATGLLEGRLAKKRPEDLPG
jgi:Glyoxalase/Bleomycin resistance protein/Dioxygenase superfamily